METAAHQYWMWMKRREILMKSSYGSDSTNNASWEEKAFAEDAIGSLNGGGCVWPPRSYSCSFCKREFRSAQALGGHMNVHRRDRARLKHSLTLQNNNSINSFSSSDHPKIPSHDQAACTTTTTLSSSRVLSGLSTHENLSDQNTTKRLLNISSSSSVSKPKCTSQTLEKNYPREEESSIISINDHDFVETNLSVGLKPSGTMMMMSCSGEESTTISCKRTKRDVSTLRPPEPDFFISNDDHNYHHHLQMEVLHGFRSASKENLDLELRLGDPPKVK